MLTWFQRQLTAAYLWSPSALLSPVVDSTKNDAESSPPKCTYTHEWNIGSSERWDACCNFDFIWHFLTCQFRLGRSQNVPKELNGHSCPKTCPHFRFTSVNMSIFVIICLVWRVCPLFSSYMYILYSVSQKCPLILGVPPIFGVPSLPNWVKQESFTS